MRKFLSVFLLWGWFFTMQAPDPQIEGVQITTLTGPFKTEAQCKQYRDSTEDSLKPLNIQGLRISPCQYVQES